MKRMLGAPSVNWVLVNIVVRSWWWTGFNFLLDFSWIGSRMFFPKLKKEESREYRSFLNILVLDEAEQDLIDGFRFYEAREKGRGNYFLNSLFSVRH